MEDINVHKYGAHIFHTNNWKSLEPHNLICGIQPFHKQFCGELQGGALLPPFEWKLGDEPYYLVNDKKNSSLYVKYKELADKEQKVLFRGRLSEYKYYDMDQVIAAALECCEEKFAGVVCDG